MAAISLGYGPDGKRIRRKVSGKTKQEVRARPQALHQELDSGVRSSSTYAVREAVDDWLREGLESTSERPSVVLDHQDARALRVSDARCLGPVPCRPVASGQVSSASTSVFVNVRYATRTMIEARNIPLVAVVPRPSPPASRGCESMSPSDAPSGRVRT